MFTYHSDYSEFIDMPWSAHDCHFYLQAWFNGKKIGHGFGRTRKEAQHKAAEDSIKHLAGTTFQTFEFCDFCYSIIALSMTTPIFPIKSCTGTNHLNLNPSA